MKTSRVLAALSSALLLFACLDPSRLNTSCAWSDDTGTAILDMGKPADRLHLANDVRIAGENATRYRDSVKTRFGFGAAGRLDDECLDRLYSTIGARHGVNRADLDAAARMRDVPLDVLLVYLPVGALFLAVASRWCRQRFRRLPPPGERWTVLVGAAWLGLIASAVTTFVAYLHAWNVDTVRLRDFHMSFRAAYLPIGVHPWRSFLVAFSLFAMAATYEYRVATRRSEE